ncbi:MAG: type IV pilus biogenesis protein PilM, partial [Polyangia bacterium]
AEALKVAFTDGDASADVARILQMTAQQMAGEFQKSIDFFLASHPDTTIGKIYLSGGSARVPPLLAAIETRARVPVEIMEPFRDAGSSNIDPAFLRNHGPQAMVSLGLALRSPGDKFQ